MLDFDEFLNLKLAVKQCWQKLAKNAKSKKIEWDILGDF